MQVFGVAMIVFILPLFIIKASPTPHRATLPSLCWTEYAGLESVCVTVFQGLRQGSAHPNGWVQPIPFPLLTPFPLPTTNGCVPRQAAANVTLALMVRCAKKAKPCHLVQCVWG